MPFDLPVFDQQATLFPQNSDQTIHRRMRRIGQRSPARFGLREQFAATSFARVSAQDRKRRVVPRDRVRPQQTREESR